MNHPYWSNLFRKTQSNEQAIASLWLATPLFNGISQHHCEKLVPDMQVRHYQPGETIFKAGDAGVGVAIIRSGTVSIRSGQTELAQLQTGDFFGEVALVTDELRTAQAIANKPCELVFFLRPHLHELMQEHPQLAATLMLNLSRVLANRLRTSNELLQNQVTGG